jgi:CheY-like chemotaxis protein
MTPTPPRLLVVDDEPPIVRLVERFARSEGFEVVAATGGSEALARLRPGLADVASRLLTRSSVAYQLDGTVTVDAGVLGQPKFGPSTLLRGDVAVRR